MMVDRSFLCIAAPSCEALAVELKLDRYTDF